VAAVWDQRLPLGEIVIQDLREPGVPALRHAGAVSRGVLDFRVEVDVEALGLQHAEAEASVLDLVATETLARSRMNADAAESDHQQRRAVT
jgi:hypothetical protein